ncbi:uncharacterized protein IL334_003910 [Kwoniella shivajii]|uniref:Uncharacterized protein n=1 Tax=Kwoniella shivajii TaxID=564305 RepID=A0ABZ1CZ92_9TREE|nr:hypothetical protein IL334_003910 [Kwoniella shivajii]
MPAATAQSTGQGDMVSREGRMDAFRKVKPTCVALMAIGSQAPTPHSQHSRLLDSLLQELSNLPQSSLDPAVINYILFPLTSILRQSNPVNLPDKFLESAFRLLAHTTEAWRKCSGGMDVVAWEQLWKLCVAAVVPRSVLDKGKGKGKGKEINQEVQLQAVNLLSSLLKPTPEHESGLLHPTPSMLDKVSTATSPLLPTLFQTITFLLETSSPSPPYHSLQLSSLRLLRPLVQTYLKGKHEVLAAVLPGIISTMGKIVQGSGKSIKGEVAQQILGLIEEIVTSTLNDKELRELGLIRPVVEDISQLAEEWNSASQPLPPGQPPPPSPTSSTSSKSSNPFPPLTASYLIFTSTQLQNALPPIISALSSHTSDLPRHAVISLSYSLILHCHESLSTLQPRCLASLLSLSKDPFDPVRHDAKRSLNLLAQNQQLALEPVVLDLLSTAVNSLPRLVTSQQDTQVDEVARLITAIAEHTNDVQVDTRTGNAIADLLGPSGGVERWSWALLNCLEFGRPSGWSSSENTSERLTQLGWEQRSSPDGVPLLLDNGIVTGQPDSKFPHLPLRYVESEGTTRSLGDMLTSLGAAGGEAALHSVEYFILFAKANRSRQVSKSVSAVWVCEKLLEGISNAQVEGIEGRISKAVRKVAREIVKILVTIDEDEDGADEEEEPDYKENPNAEALIPVERTKGIDTLTTLLDRKSISNTRTSAESSRLHNQAQRSLLTCLSLETLTLISKILSSAFRPLLLTSLYTLLAHLASPQPIIRECSTTALHQIAYHIGYSNPQNMVLDNVDYVINNVTLHLLPNRLSPTAPLVLIAMIRLVGVEIVPMVHDLVDEIFDALDDYHGYEALASSLLAVLGTLIEVMNDEIEIEGVTEERKQKMDEMRRIERPPNPDEDFNKFFTWWQDRNEKRREEIGDILGRAPQHAWGKKDIPLENKEEGNEEEEEEEGSPPSNTDDSEIPPTRSQTVCIRILEKSIFFLTHQSPFLRSRILSLISNAVPVLTKGNRETELLPLVDKSWNSILNRLDDKEPYVVTEAAQCIAKLCEQVGDFMSKRVLDHAWPRMKILLNNQKELDSKSALTNKTPQGGRNARRGMDKFTVSHKLHISILKVALFIVQEVPVEDSIIWDMIVILRPFLDTRVQEELQELTKEVYENLGKRDGDAVWLALKLSLDDLGDTEDTRWETLKGDQLDLSENATSILLTL